MKSKTTKILALTAAFFGLGIATSAMADVQSGTKVISYKDEALPQWTTDDSTIYDYVYGVFHNGGKLELSFTLNWNGSNCGVYQCIFHAGAKDTGFSIYENGGPNLIFSPVHETSSTYELSTSLTKNANNTIVCRFENAGYGSANVSIDLNGTRYNKGTWTFSQMAWDSTAAERNKYCMGCQAPGWKDDQKLQTSTIANNTITATYTTTLNKMYSNRLSTGNAVVSPGTYGAITVPGAGYKATAFTSATQLTTTTSGEEVTGSYANIIHTNGASKNPDTDVYVHTVAGWFKMNALPTSSGAANAKTLFAVKTGDHDSYAGYKVAVDSDGKIYIGQCDKEAWHDNQVSTTAGGHVVAGKWFHLAIACSGRTDSNRNSSATIFVNGQQVASTDTKFKTNLNGSSCTIIRIGTYGATSGIDISAAGIYVDQAAIASDRVIDAATNYVVAAPYTATVTQDCEWSDLWSSLPTSGADVKLIRSGDAADAKVTIDEDVTLAKLTVTSASGKSLTLKVDNTLAAATYDFSGANGTVKIGGAGRVEYTTSGTNPAYPTWTWIVDGDDEWTGTYALSGFNGAANKTTCGNEGWNLVPYYNGTKSKFEFNGTVTAGWFNNVPFSVGELVLPKGKSITFTDGHSSEYKGAPVNNYCFTKLSGEGSITINTSTTASPGIKFTDVSEFTGTISNTGSNSDGNGYRVILGEGSLKAEGDNPAKAAIHFTGKATLDKLTLNASNGVKITDDASLVFADKDSKLTVSSSVAVNSGVSIPVTIEDATGLTAGTALITWISQPAGSFSLVASGVAVGEKGFKATKGTDKLTVEEDTATTYYAVGDIESGTVTTVTFDNAWLESAGVKEAGSTTVEVQANLDAENANGIKMSDVYLMGYEAKDAQNAAVILKPDQAQSNGESISLSVAGVPTTTRNGAVITYTALASADRNWESPSVEEEMGATGSVSMALPTSGVLYYRVQANVALP